MLDTVVDKGVLRTGFPNRLVAGNLDQSCVMVFIARCSSKERGGLPTHPVLYGHGVFMMVLASAASSRMPFIDCAELSEAA